MYYWFDRMNESSKLLPLINICIYFNCDGQLELPVKVFHAGITDYPPELKLLPLAGMVLRWEFHMH